MIYKGVEFTVTAVSPDIWKWQFHIGERLVAGKTEAKSTCRPSGGSTFGSIAN